MAHQMTPDEVDAAAASHAASEQPAKQENLATPLAELPGLAYGAEGENVIKLVNVLAVLGYDSNDVIKGGEPRLDESVLVDVRAAQAALDILPATEIPGGDPQLASGVEGELVCQTTWAALYEAAAGKLEVEAG
jgi:hypothetical protein